MRPAIASVSLLGAALCSSGCQSTDRPAPAVDVAPAAQSGRSGSLVDSNGAEPALESSCGAATARLPFQRPNLYFAIDASASMLDGIPRSATGSSGAALPGDRYGVLAVAIETLLERVGHRVDYGATLFPSSDVACDAGEEVQRLSPGDLVSYAVSGEPGPVLRSLMFQIRRRTPRGGTPVAQALLGLLPELRDQGSETYVFLLTDGAPNCNSQANCGPENCIPNIEHASLSNDTSCTAPLNCCDATLYGPENCLDDAGSAAAVSSLASAGIRTFVIGIPGSEAYANVLDELARRGGMARAGSPSYYGVQDADELVDTVSRLGLGVALSCTIELTEAPPDPSLVNVYFDGQVVPADPTDGWTFVDPTTVQLVGSACALLQSGQVLQADVVAGCPVVIR